MASSSEPLALTASVNDWQLYRRLLAQVAPYWPLFFYSLLGYVIYALGTVLLADLMQFLLDAVGSSKDIRKGLLSGWVARLFGEPQQVWLSFARWVVPLAMVVFTLGRGLGYFLGSYALDCVGRNLIHDLRCALFNRMLIAPSRYFRHNSQGVLLSRITFNTEQVSGAVTKALKTVFREVLVILGLLSYMLYQNWRLCLVFLAVAPFIAWVVRFVSKRFRRYSRRIQTAMGDVSQVVNESIRGYREVRLFAAQSQQRDRFLGASDANRQQSLKLAFVDALSSPVIQTLLALALASLVWFALEPQVLSGFSAGSLVAFLVAAGQLGKPIRQLSGVMSVIQRGLAAAEDIFAQLDGPPEPDSGTFRTARAKGSIRFESVSYRYPGTSELALNDVSLTVFPGETVALVGPSGSGKTTLVHLLARFEPTPVGRIFLDDIAIEDYALDNLREQLAMVAQDVPLFRDTIFNNIAYGGLAHSTRAEVEAAASAAHALAFIEQLPAGLETHLGEQGSGLSGGQRQRLALARALLKNAPVLILDEATSALDSVSEQHIQAALYGVMRDRTTLVIAHRLATVEQADNIVVLDKGRIVASGTHADLIAAGGLYATLYHRGLAT